MTDQLLAMSKRDIDRFELLKRLIRKEIGRSHAAKLLRLTERHVTRLKKAVIALGASALIHKSRGKASRNKIHEQERQKIVRLLKEKFPDFGPTFAAEKLRELHRINRDPKTIRSIQMAEGLWKPRRPQAKSEHRSWRARRAAFGEMQQFDGSYHDWFEGRGGIVESCLLASIEDATGKIMQAKFAPHEGVFPVFGFWKNYVETHGKPRHIYLDRFSTYKMSQKVALENPDLKTQFKRAMEELGVEVIFAMSPEAKGRIERLFDTLQDRLVKELRLRNIGAVEEANRFLKEEFIETFNAKFSVEAASAANLHAPLTEKERKHLASIFSRKEERTVQNDFTFSFRNQWYQITERQPATVCKKDTVTVEEHLDHSIHIRLRGKELNVVLLPVRPKKRQAPLVIAKAAQDRKPSADHPWRRRFHADALKAHS